MVPTIATAAGHQDRVNYSKMPRDQLEEVARDLKRDKKAASCKLETLQ